MCRTELATILGPRMHVALFLGIIFVMEYTTLCYRQEKARMLLGRSKCHLKYFPLMRYRKTNPHLSTLYRVLGRTPRPAQFTNTSTSDSSKSDSEDDGVQPSIEEFDVREQAGRVNDHLSSRIEIEDSSDDDLVQEIVHEMKDVLNGISAFNPLGGTGSLLPIPTD